MHTSTETRQPLGLRDRIEAWWADWRERRRLGEELAGCGADELERIAHDVGAASRQELIAVAAAGPNGAALMADLAAAIGLDLADLKTRHPDVLRQLQITCAQCTCKSECTRDLANGTAAEKHAVYCPNAGTLAALQA